MRTLLLAAAAVAAMTGAAQAQDWSGPYVGAQLGSGSRDTTWTDLDADWIGVNVVADTSDADGVILGVNAGYNWQMGSLVLGVQGDLSYADLSSTTEGDQCSCVTIDTDLNYLLTLRGNAGWAFGAFLPYVTGGYAMSDLENSWTEDLDAPDSWVGVDNDGAWVYGAGVRWAASPRWAFGVEALRYEFDDVRATNDLSFRMDIENEIDIWQFTAVMQY